MRERRVGERRIWSREVSLRIPGPTSRILPVGLDNRLEPFPIHQYLVVLLGSNLMTYTRTVTEKNRVTIVSSRKGKNIKWKDTDHDP